MVQEGRGHAAIDVWANGEAALWSVRLSFAEREEIALLRVQGYSMQEVARRARRWRSGIDNLQRAAAQRLPPKRKSGLASIVRRQRNGTRRARCSPPKAERSLRATRR